MQNEVEGMLDYLDRIKELEYLDRIKELEEIFNGKKVAMISLSPSFDKGRENYLDYVIRSICLTGIDLRVWNPHFKNELKEEEIYRMIKRNFTISEVNKDKRRSIFKEENHRSNLGLKDMIKTSDVVNIFYSSKFTKSGREENFDYIFALNKNARVFQLDATLDFQMQRKLKKFSLRNGVCYVNLSKMVFSNEKTRELAHQCMDAMYEEYAIEKVKRI